jgi:GT2 family glycosyltransferase
MQIPILYILLPVFNRSITTQSFVQQLKSQSFQNFQLILIDDASTDDTIEKVLEILPNTIVLNGGGNSWWAGSLQLGYEYLDNKVSQQFYILLINDDTDIDHLFLEKGYQLLKEYPNSLIKATEIEKNNLQPPFRFVYANLLNNKFEVTNDVQKANCTTTRGLFMTGDVFKAIGGFYPQKLPHYLSDYEYTIRASAKGFNIICPSGLDVLIDLSKTGMSKPKFKNFKQYYIDLFSNKNMVNPKHKINFILLTQKNYFLITYHIVKTLLVSFKDFFEAIIESKRLA